MSPPPHPPPSVLSEAVLFTNCSSVRFPLDFVLIQSQRWSSFPSSLELTSLRNRWDEAASNFLVYNLAHAKRLDFVRRNSQVALNFDGYGTGSGIIVFTGHAQISPSEPSADQHPLYLAKYHHWMTSMFGSPERFAAEYSVALRISPIKVRGSSS